MVSRLVALLVDESKWPAASIGLSLVVAATLLYRYRSSGLPLRRRVLAAMNLCFGLTVGLMACGHLLAVTAKRALGTLEGSVLILYAIGVALAVPSLVLILHTREVLSSVPQHRRTTIALNTWLGFTLLALGVHNLPLAAPAFFNIGYAMHSRRGVGWAIVSVAVVVTVGMFIGSLVFLASGQSFEQFSGTE